ncbi:MAG: hypothetical protein ACRDGJ_07595 [Candidatus Limnocylindria bacterium]
MALSANVPAPLTVTVMLFGAQFALSTYVTEKVMGVVVEPLPGVAEPAWSVI